MKPSRYLIFLSLGFELVGLILACLYLGQRLDEEFKTKGLMVVILAIACLVTWMVHLIYLLKRIEKQEAADAAKGLHNYSDDA